MTAPTSVSNRSRTLLVATALFATLMLLTGCLSPDQDEAMSYMNWDRGTNGYRVLGEQNDAQVKAQAWAEKLARENRIYHSNLADGIGVRWCSLGENVGYGSSILAVEQAYMNSRDHRANILNSRWNGAGVGVAYNGNRVFTVQVFIQTC